MNANQIPLMHNGGEGTQRARSYTPYRPAFKHSGLYDEEYFLSMLHLERKRTERFGRPFSLMLIDLGRFSNIPARRAIATKVTGLLRNLTREIDMKGWYRHDFVVGIIFTETKFSGAGYLAGNIRRGMEKTLGKDKMDNVRITLHSFPEGLDGKNPDESSDMTLYPELTKQGPLQATLVVKRMIDIVGSGFALMLFSPLFLIIPIIIKATSKGPVLFRQLRMGQYGEVFTFLKFRTMFDGNDPAIHKKFVTDLICGKEGCHEAGADGGEKLFKIKSDPRVTPVGRFLRKSSLDELPQLINVLRGQMSLVGPRPPIPYEYETYDIWHKRRVVEVKPGITGLWQVKGRSRTTFDDMVRLDIQYMKEWSLWLDIKILFKTPSAVLFSKGAY